MSFKTPDVYVEELPKLPPQINEVKSAVPAFIGYTEKAGANEGELHGLPTRISSLGEYENLFGGSFHPSGVEILVDENRDYAVTKIGVEKKFYLYLSLQLFFLNGGGECYVVSVGGYDENPADGFSDMVMGLDTLAKYNEPTLIVIPDSVSLTDENEFYTLQKEALQQCGKLQDRMCILDLREGGPRRWQESVGTFRANIGSTNLKYGAAYTPWLLMVTHSPVQMSNYLFSVKSQTGKDIDLSRISSRYLNGLVVTAKEHVQDIDYISNCLNSLKGSFSAFTHRYGYLKRGAVTAAGFQRYLSFIQQMVALVSRWMYERNIFRTCNLLRECNSPDIFNMRVGAESFNNIIQGQIRTVPGELRDRRPITPYRRGGIRRQNLLQIRPGKNLPVSIPRNERRERLQKLNEIDLIFAGGAVFLRFFESVKRCFDDRAKDYQQELISQHPIIKRIYSQVAEELGVIPPSGVIAGVYAQVDSARGVWKAPANVALKGVHKPIQHINDVEQGGLNISPDGKSINAIRAFQGRGILVWGARTLAGNDNEWRYVSVRRFVMMVEESIKKSTAWVVFEPNDAALWVKVKSMIENYLMLKWREGALQGTKPDEAFFVNVGLGGTMTATDVLEGRLIIDIGLATLRPAEFIVLRIVHQLQQG